MLLLASTGWAKTDLKPRWAKQPIVELNPNDSFLVNLQRNASLSSEGDAGFLDPKFAVEVRQQYDDMVRTYELRRQYGLVDPHEEAGHDQQMNDLKNSVVNQVRLYQMKKNLKKVEKMALRDESLRFIAKPVAVAGAITAVASGAPLSFDLTDSTRLTTRTNVRDQTSQIALASPLGVGSLDFAGKAPDTTPDPTVTAERYRFSLLRDLPLSMTSGLSYGSTTSTVSASLSKQIMPNLTCVLDSTHPLYENGRSKQETFRLLYGINF